MNPFRYGQIVSGKEFCPRPGLLDQLRCLAAIAKNADIKPLSGDFLRETGIKTTSSVQAALKRMTKLKTIYRHNKKYRFANPFFSLWLLWKGY